MRLPVYDKNGQRTKDILEFDENIFGEEVREALLKEAILMYEARKRVGTHSTKGRAECSGSGRKLWRQKGTGRARVGPARPPHWRGGGVTFGPKPRDYSYSLPKKAKKVALNSAWLTKFREKEVLVIEDFDIAEPKTAKAVNVLKNMGIGSNRTMIGILEANDTLWKSVRNISDVSLELVSRFNPYALLTNKKIVLTKKAFEHIVTSRDGKIKTLDRSEVYKK